MPYLKRREIRTRLSGIWLVKVLDMADSVGTIEVGKMADLLVVEGDPLADIRILQDISRIRYVIKGGRVVASRA